MFSKGICVLSATLITLTLALPALAQGSSSKVVDRRTFEAETRQRVTELGTVDNGDGTWSFELPESFDPSIRVEGEIVTWRYAGQARFSNHPKRATSMRHWVATEDLPVEPIEQLHDMTRIDLLGRIWHVAAVDHQAWRTVLEEDERHSDETGEAEPLPKAPGEDGMPVAPGTIVPWQPTSWDHLDCNGSGGLLGNETHIWDGDGRTKINAGDHTLRQSTAVLITDNAGNPICSGVSIRQKQVLTAAHCVSDNNNNAVPLGSIVVCRDDLPSSPSPCIGAADIYVPNTYGGGSGSGGGTDFSDDWAIIELDNTWANGGFGDTEVMNMSSASDSTIDALTNVHNLGFPQFAPTCSINGGLALFHNKEYEPVAATLSKKLRLKIDGSPGQSGSPWYYCPAGNNNECGGGERGYVIGVWAGYDSFQKRFVGPKASSFKSTALAVIND